MNCWPFFDSHLVEIVWLLTGRCTGPHFLFADLHSWKPRQQPPFPVKLKRIPAAILTWTGYWTCFTGVVSSFLVVWWGSIVHVIHLNTDSCRWGWLESRGPWALSRILHALWMHLNLLNIFKLILQFTNLTVLPCSLDGILPLPTICGPSGTHKLWDFKVNFVEVI